MRMQQVTSVLRLTQFQTSERSAKSRDIYTLVLLIVALGLIAMALFGPILAPYPPNQTDVLSANLGPSLQHLFGTDSLGRDIFSRILWGAQVSYSAALLIVLISIALGAIIAIASAWFGGRTDLAISGFLNVAIAVPAILVSIIAVTVIGSGFWAPVLAMAFASSPYVARVLRSAALQERNRSYVEALVISGVSPFRINLHILRGISPILLAQTTFGFGMGLLEFGGLSFLGLGVQAPTAEWGAMVIAGRSELLAGNFQQTFSAGFMIVVSVVVFTLLGERLSRKFERKQ